MAVALVGHASTSSSTASGYTTGSLNTSGANFIAIALSEGNAVITGAVTDSFSNTWTQKTIQTALGRSTSIVYAWNATVGAGHTFSISGTTNFPAMAIAWFSGVQTTSDPFDVQNGAANGNTSTLATGSVTPTNTGSLIFTSFQSDTAALANTIDSSFNVIDSPTDTNFGHQLAADAYLIGTTSAVNPTWTRTSGSQTISVAIAVFNAAGGGGGNTWTGTQAETATTSEVFADAMAMGVAYSETATATASFAAGAAAAMTATQVETATASEAFASAFSIGTTQSESTAASESYVAAQQFGKTQAESATTSDAYALGFIAGGAQVETATPSVAFACSLSMGAQLTESAIAIDLEDRSGAPAPGKHKNSGFYPWWYRLQQKVKFRIR